MHTFIRTACVRVAIHTNDHRPVQVHVIRLDSEAVFELHRHRSKGPPTLRESFGFSEKELNGIVGELVSKLVEGLAGASSPDLAAIEISPAGLGLYWPKLDVDLYIPALMQGVLGSKSWTPAEMGRRGTSFQ